MQQSKHTFLHDVRVIPNLDAWIYAGLGVFIAISYYLDAQFLPVSATPFYLVKKANLTLELLSMHLCIEKLYY